MAHNTASPIAKPKAQGIYPKGKRPGVPAFCVGCKGTKEKKRKGKLFCGSCASGFRAARNRDAELDEMFERAIA